MRIGSISVHGSCLSVLLVCVPAYLLACPPSRACLLACVLACLRACLPACLAACLPACLLARLLACLLAGVAVYLNIARLTNRTNFLTHPAWFRVRLKVLYDCSICQPGSSDCAVGGWHGGWWCDTTLQHPACKDEGVQWVPISGPETGSLWMGAGTFCFFARVEFKHGPTLYGSKDILLFAKMNVK